MEFAPNGFMENKASLIQIVACCQTGIFFLSPVQCSVAWYVLRDVVWYDIEWSVVVYFCVQYYDALIWDRKGFIVISMDQVYFHVAYILSSDGM